MKKVFGQILKWFEDTFEDSESKDWYHNKIVESVVARYTTKDKLKEELSNIIGSSQQEQTSEWSEEDEMHLTNAILAAEKEWGTKSFTVKWLKSIRPRLQQQEQPEEENKYIDREGCPYDSEGEHCWPAGGGLHKDCDFNADALYAYYVIKDRDKVFNYFSNKCFNLASYSKRELEVWVKGNTKIVFEAYDDKAGLWAYVHTELVDE